MAAFSRARTIRSRHVWCQYTKRQGLQPRGQRWNGEEHQMGIGSSKSRQVSRRHLLKTGAAALGGGAAALTGTPGLEAGAGQAPAVLTGSQTGRPFHGLVRHASTLDIQDMRLL